MSADHKAMWLSFVFGDALTICVINTESELARASLGQQPDDAISLSLL
jgi:hypothetical protein